MPLYEYRCSRCQRRVEKIQTFSAAPLTVCESCGGPLEKLISTSAIQFKGSGWYVTDYAKKSGSVPGARNESNTDNSSSTGDAAAATKKDAAAAAAAPSSDGTASVPVAAPAKSEG